MSKSLEDYFVPLFFGVLFSLTMMEFYSLSKFLKAVKLINEFMPGPIYSSSSSEKNKKIIHFKVHFP